ncbi:cell division protein CrgA [Corynebacterium liangguodongii]|uniref:Cell division protein CrgA n=1 Tax=Corynebacterium liangguodongii TaxID=2079535 RepID=A0A2S0WBH1_9CORY|nr:cell division protein CrgA [Corynebacterium liangguodongii]AWB83104.1 cell division protein CrgA [Corynebacterium liangguodongii]PWB99295.1 cell division protein CrgA [Corynebacterium liangguodongii]
MPKAKVTNDAAALPKTPSGSTRTPVKINTGGTPMWYKVIMFGLLILGLAWLIVFYVAGDQISLLKELGPWNYLIGFSAMIVGLLMTMGWR